MQQNPTLIIWGGLFVSLFMYLGVGLVAAPETAGEPEQVDTLAVALSVASIGITGVVVMASALFKNLNFHTFTIIRAALSESIAIFGLVLCFLSGEQVYLGAFLAWSMGLFLFIFPSEKAKSAHQAGLSVTDE